ncbi:MAG: ABC transporter permease [Moraxellaceae bacterium]|nr:ABC transporter permease [Moraxellaceae bacterium]
MWREYFDDVSPLILRGFFISHPNAVDIKDFMTNRNKLIEYDSAKRAHPALEELRGILQYKDLILQLVRRDIVARYKRSALGIAWTMLQPLGMMIILSVVFSNLFHTIRGYPSYILSGLLAWTFFAQTTTAAIHQIVWGSALFHRIYLPRTSFPISAIGTGMVNLALGLIPLTLILLVTGISLTWNILFVPISILLLAAFALGVGLILSTLAIYFPDVVEMYQVILIGWMYLTPIIYSEEILPEALRFWVTNLNPMYHLVQIFRLPIYGGELPSLPTLLIGSTVALSTLLVGWLIFSKKSDEFAYHV